MLTQWDTDHNATWKNLKNVLLNQTTEIRQKEHKPHDSLS